MSEDKRSELDIKKLLVWLRTKIIYLSGLLIAIAVIATISILYIKNPNFFKDLQGYGYAGVFVLSVFLNATIIIPVSAMAIISSMGGVLPSPLLVGIIGGIGAGIGEMTAYIAGRAGWAFLA